jgi:WD40 repeat protein
VTGVDWSAQKAEGDVWYLHTCSVVGNTVMHWRMARAASPPAKPGDVEVTPVTQTTLRDEPWHTWTLPLGWPVQALQEALASDGKPACVARSGRGRLVAVGDTAGFLSIFQFPCVSARANAVNGVLQHCGGVSAVAFTPDESRIITAGLEDQLIMVSMLSPTATLASNAGAKDGGVPAGEVPLVRNLCAFVNISNNLKMVSAVLSDTDVIIWDVEGLKDGAWSSKMRARLKGHTQSVNTCRFSPDDRAACTAGRDKTLRLWDVDGAQTRCFDGHERDVIACCFSPNAELVAGSDTNKTLLVWDGKGLAATPLRARAVGHRKSILCMAWSDDSRRICTGSEDKTLRIWDLPDAVYKAGESTVDLEVVCRLRGHSEAVVSCAFSAHASSSDKMRVCSGSMDKTVLVWDVGTGIELCRLTFDDCLLGCAFSKCSGFVGAVCLDNSVHIWDVSVAAEPDLVSRFSLISMR